MVGKEGGALTTWINTTGSSRVQTVGAISRVSFLFRFSFILCLLFVKRVWNRRKDSPSDLSTFLKRTVKLFHYNSSLHSSRNHFSK